MISRVLGDFHQITQTINLLILLNQESLTCVRNG